MSEAPIVVVGGGLAGIAACVELADRGHELVLLESRARLGGVAGSFERAGVRADTGQHVFLRRYTAYRALLGRMGADSLVQIQDVMDIPVVVGGRTAARLRRGQRGPAPLHLLPAIGRYSALSPIERAAALRAARAIRAVDPDDPAVDRITFGDWLREHGQSARVIRRLWGLLCVAALNLAPDAASLALAAKVICTGLMEQVAGGDIGLIQAPLSRLHDDAASGLLERLGVPVHRGTRVTAIEAAGGGGFIVRTRAGELDARGVVLAVPHRYAARIVPAAATGRADAWQGLGSSPIINTHVHYDRPVTRLSFAATPESPVQWIFDRTAALGIEGGQYLVTSTSAADALIAAPAQEIREQQLAALEALFPHARRARVLDSFVTREPHATFRQAAGTAALRPPAQTDLSGLVLAGAWTATGWPDTMEGAVRSGHQAASVLHHNLSRAGVMPASPVRGRKEPAA